MYQKPGTTNRAKKLGLFLCRKDAIIKENHQLGIKNREGK